MVKEEIMKSVLLLVPCIQFGGTETVAIRYKRELTNNNINNTLIAICYSGNLPEDTRCLFKQNSLFYKILTFRLLRPLFYLYISLRYVKPVLNSSIIICLGEIPIICNFLNILILKKIKPFKDKKFICSFRNHHSTLNNYKNDFLKIIFKSYDLVTTNSSAATRFFSKSMKKKRVFTLYNPLPFEININKRKSIESEYINFLSVSRLEKQKNNFLLLKAFKYLQKNNHGDKKFKLHIVGYGSEFDQLNNYVKLNKLNENIKFYGKLAHNQINEIYRSSDFFIHCSKWDGIPNTVLEALYFHLPVIAYRSPNSGLNDLYDLGAPISFFETQNPYELFKELSSKIDNFKYEKFLKKNSDFLKSYREKTSLLKYISDRI